MCILLWDEVHMYALKNLSKAAWAKSSSSQAYN